MTKAHYVKAAKDYPEIGVKKGEMYYWWKHFRGPRRMSKEPPTVAQTAGSGRAARLGVWLNGLSEEQTKVQQLMDLLQESEEPIQPEHYPKAIPEDLRTLGIDASEVDELYEEMNSWAENMEGASMEHLPKYEEVDECRNALDELKSAVEGVEAPEIPESVATKEIADELVEKLDEYREALEEADSAGSGIDFPGMF
jgi:hypothetical protein